MAQRKPKLLVFQHVPYEPLGTLDPLLKAAGFRLRYVNFGRDKTARPDIDAYDGLIVLGGPMHANDWAQHPNLSAEVELLGRFVESGRPCLGICLGAQLLAISQGGSVSAETGSEIGWHPVSFAGAAVDDPLFRDFSPTESLFQWHIDSINLPSHALALAESGQCASQAFRVGQAAWGLQFHMEVDTLLINRWLAQPENNSALSLMGGPDLATEIRGATPVHIDRLQALALTGFQGWVDLFELSPRRRALPSR